VTALAKAGTLSIIGVYPQQAKSFPIGLAMNKNLAVRMGNCNRSATPSRRTRNSTAASPAG
jgi:threonine dehydrogenase-like Zn-dependent dehydrogenase